MKIPRTLKFTGKDPGIVGSEKQKLLEALAKRLRLEGETSKANEDGGGIGAGAGDGVSVSDDSLMGKVPNILIGSHNYPQVNTGFLASDDVKDEDNPKAWAQNKDIGIKDIVLMRQSLSNSRFQADVKSANRFSDKLKEVSLSDKALDAEVFFDGKVRKDFSFNVDTLPHGPVGALRTIDVLENPKVPFHVQRAESDIDLKASLAIKTLSSRGIDEHFLTKIVSAGNLGVKMQRKMVPTKWSITMIDDSLGKEYINKIRGNESHEYGFFTGDYLGNYYFCLIFPGPWSFELFETYVGGLENASEYASASDYESAFGRTTYASNTSGGYYASRIAALEYFAKKKKTGRVIMFRFITDEYWAPLGVWVVREASRNAFKSNGEIFENKDELLKHAFSHALKKFRININTLYRESKLLKDIREQKTLY